MLDTFCESFNESVLLMLFSWAKSVFLKVALCDLGRLRAASFFAKIGRYAIITINFKKKNIRYRNERQWMLVFL